MEYSGEWISVQDENTYFVDIKGALSPTFGVNMNNPASAQKLLVFYVCLQMSRMEFNCNLKTLANFFKFFRSILEMSLKTDYSVFFLGKIPQYFLHCALIAISCYEKVWFVFGEIFEQF